MSSTRLVQAIKNAQSFRLRLNDVTRDMSQGGYANRIPLSHPRILQYFRLWDSLNSLGQPLFHCIEAGGASVQVSENFQRDNYTNVVRAMRKSAPNSPIRPLWRGKNSFLLKRAPRNVLSHMLEQFAHDTAPPNSNHPELLRVKVFDSQANIQETQSTYEMVRELREAGHPVSLEVAIPYSNGERRASINPYPNDFFIKKMLEAQQCAQELGLDDAFSVSLKDMVGELDAATANDIIGSAIEAFKCKGVATEIGLHSHDTGHAFDAYMQAARVAKQHAWRLNIDTVSGQQSGFVNTLDLLSAMAKEDICPTLTSEQERVLKEMDAIQQEVRHEYRAARAPEVFTGEELRRYAIPGGGGASFINAVRHEKFAEQLNLSFHDTLHVMATALIAVGRLMGHAFPVTPGFQNKQIAAFNLVRNRLHHHSMPKGDRQAAEKALHATMSDQEVETLFLANLNPVVADFLKGDMPTPIHPVIRAKLGHRRDSTADEEPSPLPAAKELVRAMQAENLIASDEASFREAVSRALIIGVEHFRAVTLDPFLNKEVDPRGFDTSEAWQQGKERAALIHSAIIGQGHPHKVANECAEQGMRVEKHFQSQSNPASWAALARR